MVIEMPFEMRLTAKYLCFPPWVANALHDSSISSIEIFPAIAKATSGLGKALVRVMGDTEDAALDQRRRQGRHNAR